MKKYFDEASITENRMAVLTDRQKKWLWWSAVKSLFLNIVSFCFILLIARETPLFVLVAFVATGLFLYFSVTAVSRCYQDISSDSLYIITGHIEKYILFGRRSSEKCFVRIQNQPPLAVSGSFYKELLNRSKYRFFITENGNQLMNFESLTPDIEVLDYPVDIKYWFYLLEMKFIPLGVFLVIIASLIIYGLTQ